MRGAQREVALACLASAVASFAIFAAPGAPESLPRAALLLTSLAAFILAPVALLWWLGSRTEKAERARERRTAAAAWRAALAEASASAAFAEFVVSPPLGPSAPIRPFNGSQPRACGEDRANQRYGAVVPPKVAAGPDHLSRRLEQAIESEMARFS